MSVGPLLGELLGGFSWRGPFFGVALLMIIGFVAVFILLDKVPKPTKKSSILDPIKVLEHGGLLSIGLTALFYNFGFFTLLAFSPFVLGLDAHGIGYVFFFWGVFLAISSVIIAPKLQRRFGTKKIMYMVLLLFTLLLIIMGLSVEDVPILIICIILSGGLLGINNTLITTAVMEVSPVELSVASSAYSFVRFVDGAIAPWLAGKLSEWFNPHIPFYFGGVAVLVGLVVLYSGRKYMVDLK
jgi:predicted MFS family arabinose efflux permease